MLKYTQILVKARSIYIEVLQPDNTIKEELLEGVKYYTITDISKGYTNQIKYYMDISKFYKYYNTDEIVEPTIMLNKFRNKYQKNKEKAIKNEK